MNSKLSSLPWKPYSALVVLTPSMKKEFSTRPTYDLAGQLRIMNRASGKSEVDDWFTKISAFMQGNGTFPKAPEASAFIDDKYMKMVEADPKLKAYANKVD